MPIEFDNTGPAGQPKDARRPERPPALEFAQEAAESGSVRQSSYGWLWLVAIITPYVGIFIGLYLLQQVRHSDFRGHSWADIDRKSILAATILSCLWWLILIAPVP